MYAALLDVLGYRERLERDRKSGTLEFKDLLESSLQCLARINSAQFAYQSISDTIIIVCPERERFLQLLEVLRDVQVSFLQNGLFIRGGVSFQTHFQSGAITYSHAFAAAHEIESKLALYPRIVVDHNIIEMFESSGTVSELSTSGLLCECNGVYFVNVATKQNWMNLRDCGKNLYESDKSAMRRAESVHMKHMWFQEYLMASEHAPAGAARYMPPTRTWKAEVATI